MRNQLFLFSTGALYRGPVQDNRPHRHHALQIVLSPEPFRVVIDQTEYRARCILIAPNVEHALDGRHSLQSVFLLEGDSAAGEYLRDRFLGTNTGFVPEDSTIDESLAGDLSPELDSNTIDASTDEWDCARALRHRDAVLKNIFQLRADPPVPERDERIARVCRFIESRDEFRVSLEEAAKHIRLSEGRLTHLFKQQTGVPLRRFILWLRIRRAIASAASGSSLTTAAHAAGFADQAHFSRSFRDMFGLSPRESLSAAGSVRIVVCEEDGGHAAAVSRPRGKLSGD